VAPKGPPGQEITRVVFLRALGAIYLIAFASLLGQVDGLVGPQGISPLGPLLARVTEVAAAQPITGWPHLDHQLLAPGLVWWLPTDHAAAWLSWLGLAASALTLSGRFQGPALLTCFVAYLSLGTACQRFLSFQWDTLLCEVGFAALLIAPWGRQASHAAVPWGFWTLRWILFRLMLFAGYVKLASGDSAWWDGTALGYHYETQPLPNPLSWYVHHLPMAWHRLETLLTFVVELPLALLALGPRRLRGYAFGAYTGLMALLFCTGNYGFFQLLTVVLALSLLDDQHWRKLRPTLKPPRLADPGPWRRGAVGAVAALLVATSLVGMAPRYFNQELPGPLDRVRATASTFRVVNHYGLFARMTRTRPIPVLEARWGDGAWTELTWRWQTSDPEAAPGVVAPHMPRLDWQLWFAGLSDCAHQPWAPALLRRVVEGSQPVAALIGDLRLAGSPPDEARLVLYEYQFSDPGSGEAWWTREAKGVYCPAVAR
jgi:hypothetical protein